MTVSLDVNGVTYFYPETGDTNWGAEATQWAQAVTVGMLQKAGGLFTLLADVDFGATYGLKSEYYKSRTADVSSAGTLRLAVTDTIGWRNNANGGNLLLSVNASDKLEFNGVEIGNFETVSNTSSINLTLTGQDLTADLNLSTDLADPGTQLVDLEIKLDGLKGSITDSAIISAIPFATSMVNGLLSSTDWSIFNSKQAGDADLSAIAGLSTSGLITRTGAGTAATRTITGTANRISVSNGDGVAGEPTIDLGVDAVTIAGSSTGIVARTGSGSNAVRTLTGTSNRILITNGDGVSGNPTFDIGTDVVTLTGTQALTNKDYDGGSASNSLRLTLPKGTTSTLNGLTRKEGTLLYDTTTGEVKFDNGATLAPFASQVQATATTLGVVKGGTLPGQGNDTAIAAGYVGERKTAQNTGQSITSGDQDMPNSTITLTSGVWLIYATVVSDGSGSAFSLACQWKYDGVVNSTAAISFVQEGWNNTRGTVQLHPYYALVPASTTKDILVRVNPDTTQTLYSYVSAIRIA